MVIRGQRVGMRSVGGLDLQISGASFVSPWKRFGENLVEEPSGPQD